MPVHTMPEICPSSGYDENAIKHAHLPRSIWAARVVWGRWDASNLRIMIDVEQCSGCCVGPHGWTVTSNDRDGLGIPGLMKTLRRSHCLELDGRSVWFDECSHQRIALGDYGDFSDGHFKRYGNVLEHMQDMQSLGFDPTDPAYRPVVSRASGYHSALNRMQNQNDLVATFHNEERHLELYQPVGLSLPNNRHFTLLLKALSTRLADKHLVIRVIQCSQVYAVDRMGERKDLGGSALDGGRCSLEPSTYTPLCTIASPQVWRRGPACVLRREQFKGIRLALTDNCVW
ncbi:hypothetical protein F5J12DRAFT_545133 [Pisolithus orientalis]|uniref:uncharacterized protein n=1 Tax=Pisolithus orientalis TaxID=936130 RepID=UPI0022243B4E|nr:uncharacterized protein F5J12DRAFT_545133 [Pisolithus orientalis]KAI6012664.1 hypothetical protein F5J12DRAFT_545133 [Pisolithus orientalis]